MKSSRLRSLLLTAVLLAFCGVGWYYFAPTQIGGSTHYVITHGISMEPMLHTGDLALVRPESDYRVGQVVAYHSTLLHTVVLHRIIGIAGGHYTFKGINNSFIDPTHPTRSLLIGAMWLHIPHGGTVLEWIHKPWVAAALVAAVAMMLLFGGDQRRRRQRKRGRQPATPSPGPALGLNAVASRQLSAVAAVVALLFAGLGVYAFIQPSASATTTSVPYTQQVSFGYRAHVPAGPVYPTGEVTTGDPLYSPLVRHLSVSASYRLTSTSAYRLIGSVRLRATVANSTGWSRSFWLGSAAKISNGHAVAAGTVSLAQLHSLVDRVSTQIGAAGGSYALTIVPQLNLKGEIGGQPLSDVTQPSLDLNLTSSQLLAGSTAPGAGLAHTTNGDVTTAHSSVDKLGSVPITTARLIAIAGFVLFALLAAVLGSRVNGDTPDPAERINARYKHLIVPVSEIHTNPDNPPIEVRTIEALAQLAERSERLILHDHRPGVDNYMIDDQGTLFRFQSLRIDHVNGNGSGGGTASHEPAKVAAAVGASAEAEQAGAGPESADETGSAGSPAAGPIAGTTAAEQERGTPLNGFAPLSDPVEDAEAIRLSSKVTPVIQGPQPRRPPVPNYAHWSQRPEVRVGFTLGPLLTLLALSRVRAKRSDRRLAELDERSFAAERKRSTDDQQPNWGTADRRQPQRSPGDRRRGDRRRNR